MIMGLARNVRVSLTLPLLAKHAPMGCSFSSNNRKIFVSNVIPAAFNALVPAESPARSALTTFNLLLLTSILIVLSACSGKTSKGMGNRMLILISVVKDVTLKDR